MSIEKEVPATPAPQSYTDTAQARVAEIRAMREQIPNLVIPDSKSATRRLNSAASVPQPFIELAAVAVTNIPVLVRGGGVDPAQIRDLLSYAEAYAPVADELEALVLFVRHSVVTARNKAGSDALTTYALAQRMAKRPETADLAPHVDAMRNALGNRFRRAKSKPAQTLANPGTAPAPTQSSPVTTSSPAAPSK
jgi:hypothetical protein